MTSFTATITDEGQVTLPKEVRDLLGIGAGDSVQLELLGGKLVIQPQKPVPDFAAMIGKYPRHDGLTAQEWQEEMRGDPEDRAALHAGTTHSNVTRLRELFGEIAEEAGLPLEERTARKPA